MYWIEQLKGSILVVAIPDQIRKDDDITGRENYFW